MCWSPNRSSIVYQNWKGIEYVAFLSIQWANFILWYHFIPVCVRWQLLKTVWNQLGRPSLPSRTAAQRWGILTDTQTNICAGLEWYYNLARVLSPLNFFHTPGSRPLTTSRVDHIFQDTAQLKGVNSRLTFSNYWFTVLVILLFM